MSLRFVWEYVVNCISLNFNIFLLKINIFIYLNYFDVLILKIKNYYFNIFLNKKYFKPQI